MVGCVDKVRKKCMLVNVVFKTLHLRSGYPKDVGALCAMGRREEY